MLNSHCYQQEFDGGDKNGIQIKSFPNARSPTSIGMSKPLNTAVNDVKFGQMNIALNGRPSPLRL